MELSKLYQGDREPITVRAEWESLFRSMNYWRLVAKKQSGQLPSRLGGLVNEASYFAFRLKEFIESVPDPLYEQADTNSSVVLHRARVRLVGEWDTIQQALEQRQTERYRARLSELDALATECLRPVLGEDAAGQAVTYFHKVYDIVRFAFSQAPLLGAPYSALHTPESWLAIPHEAGHYVYWNSTQAASEFSQFQIDLEHGIARALADKLAARKRTSKVIRRPRQVYTIWLSWLSEVFADVYGTLVAGPASAWGIQASLRTRYDQHALDENDGEHPYPYLRPFIHIATLRRMAGWSDAGLGAALHQDADLLERSWRASWPAATIARLEAASGRGRMDLMISDDLPAVLEVLLATPIPTPEGAGRSLHQLFLEGAFYNAGRHTEISAAIKSLLDKQMPASSSWLVRCAAAQMAVASGYPAELIRTAMGFTESPYDPDKADLKAEDRTRFDAYFADYLLGATGTDNAELQQQAWNMVIEASLSVEEGESHEHGHHHWHNH